MHHCIPGMIDWFENIALKVHHILYMWWVHTPRFLNGGEDIFLHDPSTRLNHLDE
jgi:hypothetical protein